MIAVTSMAQTPDLKRIRGAVMVMQTTLVVVVVGRVVKATSCKPKINNIF